jgi:putative transposase
MKKSRFTQTQIVSTLQKAEHGHKISDICRELGISEAPSITGGQSMAA